MNKKVGKSATDKTLSAAPVFKKTTLGNGVRVVTENHPAARGVATGFWIGCGTRDEASKLQGVSHFVEHLVFKRTKKRSAYEIARDMEAVGGDLNAFTSRESTCFHTHSLKEHLDLSIDVLSDLVSTASFHKDDFEKEKQVVIQEIHMTDEQLEDSIFDVYFQKAYGKNPIGWQILGTEKTITQMKRSDVVEYYDEMYVGANITVSVAGALDHDEVVKLIDKQFKPRISTRKKDFVQANRKKPELKTFKDFIQKPSEQVHILMGMPASDFTDEMRFESYIVNTLLGGGMTSKLYQSIREDRGLAYSIYSHLSTFTDSGILMIYAGTESKNVKKVVELIEKELKRLKKMGVTRADLNLFKTQVKGQILLGADDVENRMNSLGVNEMVFEEYRSVERVMGEIDAVNLDSIHEYIEKYIDPDQLGMLLMGAFKGKKSENIF